MEIHLKHLLVPKYTAIFSFPSADREINAGIKSPLEAVLKNRVLHIDIEE